MADVSQRVLDYEIKFITNLINEILEKGKGCTRANLIRNKYEG
jgi:hypothetical protein